MTTRLVDKAAGAAAALPNPPYTQGLLAAGITVNRDGSGHFVPSAVDALGNDIIAYRNDASFGANQWSRAKINVVGTPTSNWTAVIVNAQGSGGTAKYYSFFTDTSSSAGGTGIWKATAGATGSAVASFAVTFAVGDEMLMWRIGDTFYCYKNGTLIGTYTDNGVTNGAVINGGAPGLGYTYTTGTAPKLSDFECGDTAIVFLRTAKVQDTIAGNRTVTIQLNVGESAVFSYSQVWDTALAKAKRFPATFSAGTWVKQGATVGWNDGGTGNWATEQWTCLACPSASSVVITFTGGPPTADACIIDVYAGIAEIGATTSSSGTGADPLVDLTTTAADSWAHGVQLDWDFSFVPTQKGQTPLRNTYTIGAGADVAGGTTDGAASASGAVARNEVTLAAVQWVYHAVELKSVSSQLPPLQYKRTRPPLNQRAA